MNSQGPEPNKEKKVPASSSDGDDAQQRIDEMVAKARGAESNRGKEQSKATVPTANGAEKRLIKVLKKEEETRLDGPVTQQEINDLIQRYKSRVG